MSLRRALSGRSRKLSMGCLRIQPKLHARFQHTQRQRAVLKHSVMKLSLIKFNTQPALRFFAQLADLELADLVRQCLPWPNDVPVNFRDHVLIGLSRVFAEIVDSLLPRPTHGMHSGIHHEPHGAPHFVAELAEFRIRIFVHPYLFAETLGIQRPAFYEGCIASVPAEFRNSFEFLSEGNLQMMARHGLVKRERFHLPLRSRVQLVRVYEIPARSARVRSARLVIRRRLRRRLKFGYRSDAIRQTRQLSKQARQLRIHLLHNEAVAVHQIVGLVVEESRISPQKFRKLVKAALERGRCDDFFHLRVDALHFREANFVNLLGCETCSGLEASAKSIVCCAVWQSRHSDTLAAGGNVCRGEIGMQFLKRGHNRAGVHALGAIGQTCAIRFRKAGGKCRERFQQGAGHRFRRDQISNLLGHVTQCNLRRGIPALQAVLQESEGLLHGDRQSFQACQHVFIVCDCLVRHEGQNLRSALLDAIPLVQGHQKTAAASIVAILRPLFDIREKSGVQVIVELLHLGKLFTANRFQHCNAVTKMLFPQLDSLRGIVPPAAVLTGKTEPSCGFGLIHQCALPVFIEKGAELFHLFCLNTVVSCSVVRQRKYRRNRQRATKPYCQQHRCSHHISLLTVLAKSLSRSRASMTIKRAVSSTPIAVLSTSTASAARTSGETFRSRSRLSRSITSSKTSGSVSRSPFSWCSSQRRSARPSGEASRKIFSSALGNTTVPMSRPPITIPPPAPARCCSATSTCRTFAIVASRDAACATSIIRISRVTSAPSRKTQFFAPAASCSGLGALSSICVSLASASSLGSSSSEAPRRSAFSASARYIAPLSRYKYPSIAATRRATLLLPDPAGPSMAMVSFGILVAQPLLAVRLYFEAPANRAQARAPVPLLKPHD